MNAESADQLDQRRDLTVRHYGVACVAMTVGAAGMFVDRPWVSAVLGLMLAATGVAWRTTLTSLTAKLAAKNAVLTNMEAETDIYPFLTKEQRRWEELGRWPLEKSLKVVPFVFVAIGLIFVGAAALGPELWSNLVYG